jgi:hypothetical protein
MSKKQMFAITPSLGMNRRIEGAIVNHPATDQFIVFNFPTRNQSRSWESVR